MKEGEIPAGNTAHFELASLLRNLGRMGGDWLERQMECVIIRVFSWIESKEQKCRNYVPESPPP